MKSLYILFLISISGYCQERKDYEIARIALSHLHEYKEFRLLSSPNNKYIEEYLNGFYTHSTSNSEILDYSKVKFTFNSNPVISWAKTNYWGKSLNGKIQIIDNFESVPKVSLRDFQQAKSYVALSNPAFSEDGQYAIIFYETFTNMNGTDAEGFVLIFKRVRDEWVYFSQFTAYLT